MIEGLTVSFLFALALVSLGVATRRHTRARLREYGEAMKKAGVK